MRDVKKRVRDHIRVARNEVGARDNAPALAHHILQHHWDGLTHDGTVLRHLVSIGLNAEIRSYLKLAFDANGEPANQLREQQLSMWPTDLMREQVRIIDRERVWVPSRDEFVEVVPDAATPDEFEEASRYLYQMGQDAIRRSRAIWQLAQLMRRAKAA